MKIFWSWQSDTPGKIRRFVVRDALRDAIEQRREAPDIEEPTRQENRELLHLDQDMQGVPGSRNLADTILEKIGRSTAVVADVTCVGSVTTGAREASEANQKRTINSNVAIELGYALRALGEDNLYLVFNAHYGSHEELPFDLRHRGGSIVFDLAPDATSEAIRSERKRLTAIFVGRLGHYVATPKTVAQSTFLEQKATTNRATNFNSAEVLAAIGVRSDNDLIEYSHEAKPFAYLRLIPTKSADRPLALSVLREAVDAAPTFSSQYGSLTTTNRYGAIAYIPKTRPPKGAGVLGDTTQLFDNGEIWSVSATLVVLEKERGGRPAWVKSPMIPSFPFEDRFYRLLRNMINFARDQLVLEPPFQTEAGLTDVEGAHITMGSSNDAEFWTIKRPEIFHRAVINNTGQETLDCSSLPSLTRFTTRPAIGAPMV